MRRNGNSQGDIARWISHYRGCIVHLRQHRWRYNRRIPDNQFGQICIVPNRRHQTRVLFQSLMIDGRSVENRIFRIDRLRLAYRTTHRTSYGRVVGPAILLPGRRVEHSHLVRSGQRFLRAVNHAHVSPEVVETIERHLTDATLVEAEILVDEAVSLEGVRRLERHVTVTAL